MRALNLHPRPYALRAPALLSLFLIPLLAACGAETDATPLPDAPAELLDTSVIIATDYQTGAVSVADVGDMSASGPIGVVHADAVVRAWGDRAIVLNRYGADNLQILSRDTGFDTELQFSVGNGANPHDVAIDAQGRAIVTLFDLPHLGLFDPLTGDALGEIDLGPLADGDGIPEADAITLVGDRAFVSLQRLNRSEGWAVEGQSIIAVVDLTTDTLVDVDPEAEGIQGIPLPFPSPTDRLIPLQGGRLACVTTGLYTRTGDGGLLTIDTEPPYAVTVVADEAALGGSANYLATDGVDRFFLIVNILKVEGAFEADTALITVDSAGGAPQTLLRTNGYALADIAVDGRGRLIVSDRTATRPGLHVLDAQTLAPIGAGFIPTALPPFSLGVFGAPTETLP